MTRRLAENSASCAKDYRGQFEMSALISDGSVGENSFLVENYFWQPAFKKPRLRSFRFRSMDILEVL
jgi:hypothetical protein